MHRPQFKASVASRQRGISLIVVMLLLIIASILGAGAAQIASMGERSARNERDMQLAWQSAEAALMDAEYDIHGPGTSRNALLGDVQSTNAFVVGCGSSGTSKGLCALTETGKPAWLAVTFDDNSSSAKTTAFGDITGRPFAAKADPDDAGILPALKPRYIIEPLSDPLNRDKSVSAPPAYIFRVTAMGFGPRKDIQAVSQILYRN